MLKEKNWEKIMKILINKTSPTVLIANQIDICPRNKERHFITIQSRSTKPVGT